MLTIVLGLATAVAVQAGTIALTGFTDTALATSDSDQLYGWFFDATSGITLTDFGVFDVDNDGLAVSHEVGIFRVSDHALLGSATIPAGTGATLLNSFRYVPVTPLALPTGAYAIMMTMPANNTDAQNILGSSAITSPPITYVDSAFGASPVLDYPTDTGVFATGLFGPNFQFIATPAPEPGSAFLFAAGGLALAFPWLRKTLSLHS